MEHLKYVHCAVGHCGNRKGREEGQTKKRRTKDPGVMLFTVFLMDALQMETVPKRTEYCRNKTCRPTALNVVL